MNISEMIRQERYFGSMQSPPVQIPVGLTLFIFRFDLLTVDRKSVGQIGEFMYIIGFIINVKCCFNIPGQLNQRSGLEHG